jgi:ribonucleotide monophosphatase NagD (HAD superfamily)
VSCCAALCVLQVTVDGPGLITMPGTLAKHYSQLGGRVQLMGKPDPLIYAAAQELTAHSSSSSSSSSSQAQRWLAIGDSLEHDVAG